MKVFNLKCDHGHSFEGWFRSHLAFQDQQSRGLLTCPFCDSRVIEKTLSAPRLNLSGTDGEDHGVSAPSTERSGPLSSVPQPAVSPAQAAAVAAVLRTMRQMLSRSEDVGDRFADEARAIHAQEAPARAIHGSTSLQTAQELAEEGIPVVAVPFAGLLKTPLQ